MVPALATVMIGATACVPIENLLPGGATTSDQNGGVDTSNSTSVGALELKVGDCFIDEGLEGSVESVPVVPCTESHTDEIIHAFDMSGNSAPGESEVKEAFEAECVPAFERYVGIAWVDSELDMWPMYPTTGSWAAGDREMLCVAYLGDGGTLTESVRGSMR